MARVNCCYKMEVESFSATDRISNLPFDAMERILMCLPMMDAVKTSILSSKWKNKWTTIPELVFDDGCVLSSSSSAEVCQSKFVNFVNQVLLRHQGPIQKFKVHSSYMEECEEMYQWIECISWRDIKEFSYLREDCEFWDVAPMSLYSFQYLTHLELFGCFMHLPDGFSGFRHLKSLSLQQSFESKDEMQWLLPKLPHLESFTLTTYGTSSLYISAPNLTYLQVQGEIKDLYLEDTPLLSTLHVSLIMDREILDHLNQTTTCNLIKVIGGTPLLERVVGQSYFVKHLSKNVPKNLPVQYDRLKELELYDVDFEDVNEISVAICLIVNSPNLKEFTCSSCSIEKACIATDLDYWETQHSLNCSFERLEYVVMEDVSGFPNELEFIKFMLAKSSVLKNMSIKPSGHVVDKGWDALIEMLKGLGCVNVSSPRSTSADSDRIFGNIEIVYVDPDSISWSRITGQI